VVLDYPLILLVTKVVLVMVAVMSVVLDKVVVLVAATVAAWETTVAYLTKAV